MPFRPLSARDVRWASASGTGLEHLHITATPEGVAVRSSVIGEDEGRRFGAFYELRLDSTWRTSSLRIETAHGDALELESPAPGLWLAADGTSRDDLAGCIDVDLSATPFTNTLPIRRLGEALAQPREIRVAYVSFETFEPTPAAQRYHRLASALYRYENVDGSFTADLAVDEDGLVTDYPDLFRRL